MKKYKYIFIAAIFLTVPLMLISCKGALNTPEQSVSTTTAVVKKVKISEEKLVSMFIPPQTEYTTVTQCPVTKEKFKITKNTKGAVYAGKNYYFCCPDCQFEFTAEPKKYAR